MRPSFTPGRLLGALALACTLGATAQAGTLGTTLTFNFATLKSNGAGTCSGNCNLGVQSATFTQNGISLTATAGVLPTILSNSDQQPAGATVSQRFGNPNGAETGLGVFSAGDSTSNGSSLEIAPNETLLLDNTAALQAGYRLTGISIGSIQNGEGGAIYGLSSPISAQTLLGTLKNSPTLQTFSFNANDNTTPYLLIQGVDVNNKPGANVLVHSLEYTKVPEPGSLALLGTGLLGLMLVGRRRRSGAIV